MKSHPLLFVVLVALVYGLVSAHSWRRRTPAEKVADAKLIVHGVATLEGLPLQSTERPVQRSCKVVVLDILWPTNTPVEDTIVVPRMAWTKWPDTWWNYTSQTGIYFFERTATQLKRIKAEVRKGDPRVPEDVLNTITTEVLGTNVWTPLDRMDDWYEPATNITAIKELISRSKK